MITESKESGEEGASALIGGEEREGRNPKSAPGLRGLTQRRKGAKTQRLKGEELLAIAAKKRKKHKASDRNQRGRIERPRKTQNTRKRGQNHDGTES
jgi:hypothetical protein